MKSIPGAFYSEVAASVPSRGQTKTHEYLLTTDDMIDFGKRL